VESQEFGPWVQNSCFSYPTFPFFSGYLPHAVLIVIISVRVSFPVFKQQNATLFDLNKRVKDIE
jgi:hypothetical protein